MKKQTVRSIISEDKVYAYNKGCIITLNDFIPLMLTDKYCVIIVLSSKQISIQVLKILSLKIHHCVMVKFQFGLISKTLFLINKLSQYHDPYIS